MNSSKIEQKDENEVELGQQTSESVDIKRKPLSWVDNLLSLWILIAIAIGLITGHFVPNLHKSLNSWQVVGVSGYLDYQQLFPLKKKFIPQLIASLIINVLIAPLVMLALSWIFLPDKRGLREGLILVGLARCIAMVLVWTNLAKGNNELCALIVGINSVMQIILFAPLAVLYINVVSRGTSSFSYSTVAKSVGVFLGAPLAAAIICQLLLGRFKFFEALRKIISPLTLISLLFTIFVIFASSSNGVTDKITDVLRVVPPLIFYFALLFFATYFFCRQRKYDYEDAITHSFTAASNNFELAIAVAISTYGSESGQALASVVGPFVEIPIMLALVYFAQYLASRYY